MTGCVRVVLTPVQLLGEAAAAVDDAEADEGPRGDGPLEPGPDDEGVGAIDPEMVHPSATLR